MLLSAKQGDLYLLLSIVLCGICRLFGVLGFALFLFYLKKRLDFIKKVLYNIMRIIIGEVCAHVKGDYHEQSFQA